MMNDEYQKVGGGSIASIVDGMSGSVEEVDGFDFGAVDVALAAIILQPQVTKSCQSDQQVFRFSVNPFK